MAVPSSQNDCESRFAHLLQPIRDLSKNWDIDLASELEDYLSEVRRHSFVNVFFMHGVIDRVHSQSDIAQKMLLTVQACTAIRLNCG